MDKCDVQPTVSDTAAAKVDEMQLVVAIDEDIGVAQITVTEYRLLSGHCGVQMGQQLLRCTQVRPWVQVLLGVQVMCNQVLEFCQAYGSAAVEWAINDGHRLQLPQRFVKHLQGHGLIVQAILDGFTRYAARDYEFALVIIGSDYNFRDVQPAIQPLQDAGFAQDAVSRGCERYSAGFEKKAFTVTFEAENVSWGFTDFVGC